ncbi:MAG: type IX secretion system sortase PorU [Candidatus Limisoma sp.]
MKKIIYLAILLLTASFNSHSQNVEFASRSVLATGNWAKINVDRSGVYEISYDELRSWGFATPENVKVYGRGGNAAKENYLLPHMDDLEQTPVMHRGNKIYFYAKGIERDSIKIDTTGDVTLYPSQNCYSKHGCLFLTDSETQTAKLVADAAHFAADDLTWSDVGFDIWTKEDDIYNPGKTGKTFLGENISQTGTASYTAELPTFLPSGNVYLSSSLALMGTKTMNVNYNINGTDLSALTGSSLSGNSEVSYLEYGVLVSNYMGSADALNAADTKQMNITMTTTTTGAITRAWVDYIALCYPSTLTLPDDMAQIRHFATLTNGAGLQFSGKSGSTFIWLVDDATAASDVPYDVKNCQTVDLGDGTVGYHSGLSKTWGEFIMFDTEREQLRPEYVGPVANQDLHGAATPDMLIITNSILFNQAERLAEFHRTTDGMDVLVVDQQQVFNEFSSGVRDAMAYRMICKMFYDRDPEKFQYMLLFGNGTYDNRMIYTNEASEQLVTYQSDASNSQTRSYCSDDFFAFLDNSSASILTRRLCIAVGRIPLAAEDEASAYVDKIINYRNELNAEQPSWKNSIMFIGENGDDDIHVEQCETFQENFLSSGYYDMSFDKLYLAAYDEQVVRDKFVEYLNRGERFGVYIGHGTPISLTKTQIITNLDKAIETKYQHLPIIYFSTCDIARFDNGCSNIVSQMLTNTQGGLVACVASTRVVYTNLNGRSSDSFARSLAKHPDYYGGRKTLGKVFIDAKRYAGEQTVNHMKYHIIGDPALPLELPLNRVTLTKANDTSLSNAKTTVSAPIGSTVAISGEIRNSQGEPMTNFDGFGIVQLYDARKYYLTAKKAIANNTRPDTDLYTRGALLTETKVDVNAGQFTCNITIPEFAEAGNDSILPVRIIAVDHDDRIFSGVCRQIVMNRTDAAAVEPDTDAPEITALYINNKDTFVDGMEVEPDIVLCAEISDNGGINGSSESFVSSMTVQLDGGKTTRPVVGYSPQDDNTGLIQMPFYDLSEGRHVAELIVPDLSGNVSRRTISFTVNASLAERRITLDRASSFDEVTIDIDNADGAQTTLVVKNSLNDEMLRSDVTFPYRWDLRDAEGNKLPAGDYDIYAIVDGRGSKVQKFVILK